MEESSLDRELGQVVKIDEGRIREHLGELVRGTVEETLNGLLDAEAEQLCNAARYERRRSGGTAAQGTIGASCRPRPARSSCRCPSCEAAVRDGDRRAVSPA